MFVINISAAAFIIMCCKRPVTSSIKSVNATLSGNTCITDMTACCFNSHYDLHPPSNFPSRSQTQGPDAPFPVQFIHEDQTKDGK